MWVRGLTVGLLLMVSMASAQDCVRYDRHLRWLSEVWLPGVASAVVVHGQLALALDDNDLEILSIADPENTVVLGNVDLDGATDLVARGDIAFVTGADPGSGRLAVVDLADPAEPAVSSSVPLPLAALAVAATSGPLAVATGDGGGTGALLMVDPFAVSGQPVLGSVDLPASPRDVAVMGDHALVAVRSIGVLVVDISDPAAPVVVGSSEPLSPHRLLVRDGVAYVATESPAIVLLDVTTPTSPTVLGQLAVPTTGVGLDLVDDRLVVAVGEVGLLVLDVADPTSPTLLGALRETEVTDIALAGYRALAPDGSSRLHEYDVTWATAAEAAGGLAWSGDDALGVAVADQRAYVADGDAGLRIIDVSEPTAPVLLTTVDTAARAIGVDVVGQTVYVTDQWPGALYVFDATDPAAVTLLGQLLLPDISATDVAVSGDVALIGGYCSGSIGCDALVLDVSSPQNMQIIGTLPMSGYATDVVMVDHRAYATAKNTGVSLQIFDLTDPSAAVPLGSLAVNELTHSLCVVDDMVYITDFTVGLAVIDAADPTQPVLLGTTPTPGRADDVVVRDGVAYVADGDGGCQVVDVSDPTRPTVLGSLSTAGSPYAVAATPDGVVLSDRGHGLAVAWSQCDVTTGVRTGPAPAVPPLAAYPNPFNPRVTVSFDLSRSGPARVAVHDLAGRRLAVLTTGPREAGRHTVVWDGRDHDGRAMPSGAYMVRLEAAGSGRVTKVMLLR